MTKKKVGKKKAARSVRRTTPAEGGTRRKKTRGATGRVGVKTSTRGAKKTKVSKATSSVRERSKSARRRKSSGVVRNSRNSRILVTGATGFLGKHLIDCLLKRTTKTQSKSVAIRALVRTPTLHLERSKVEMAQGDVCDEAACRKALKEVGSVYHLAGFVSRDEDDGSEMFRVHVEGTRTLLRVAREEGVRRVVVVSTSGTVGVSRDPDAVANEHSPYAHTTVSRWPYYLSKIYQEQTALRMARELGIEVVIVNPSLVLGPGDERGSSTMEVENVVRGRLSIVPTGGGVAFVDARDAAEGLILAMEHGVPGGRYLLSAANMTLETFLGRVARLAQVPTPRTFDAPRAFKMAGRLVGALYRQFGTKPPIDEQSIQMAEHTWYVDASKAIRELGWTPRSPQETLVDTVRDVERRVAR